MKSRASALYFTSFQNYTKDASSSSFPREQAPESYIYMKITITIITWIFTLFPNLITKESYNWWLTRRIWGLRQQKYEEKYLKMSVAHIGKFQENIATLCKMAAKLSG